MKDKKLSAHYRLLVKFYLRQQLNLQIIYWFNQCVSAEIVLQPRTNAIYILYAFIGQRFSLVFDIFIRHTYILIKRKNT